ncbi:hypothetical protein TNCT_651951 [Trichonephila clavata]|uniref:Uncharacterized protein n=1 Tax=Trichonephila clavata TaxID=2740835 RepID=A0A8X6HV36_TRICU|nr:hypothetical protein TNCT_651951 [Trichonephila clavata]
MGGGGGWVPVRVQSAIFTVNTEVPLSSCGRMRFSPTTVLEKSHIEASSIVLPRKVWVGLAEFTCFISFIKTSYDLIFDKTSNTKYLSPRISAQKMKKLELTERLIITGKQSRNYSYL